MDYCYQRKKIFKDIYHERLDRLEELSEKFDYHDLKFVAESTGAETDFTKIENPIVFFNNIKTNEIRIQEAKNLQEEFNEYLKKIRAEKNSLQNKSKMLIFFLAEEIKLLNLLKTLVQWFLKPKENKLKEKDLKHELLKRLPIIKDYQ